MKLTEEEIQYVDRWLEFSGIEYLDIRFELVDHLIIEFEQSKDHISLEGFVKKRLAWCKSTAKKKENAMHWGIQKALRKRFSSLLVDPRTIIPLLLYVISIFLLADLFSTPTVRFLYLGPVLFSSGLMLYLLIFKNFRKEKKAKVLAMKKLGSLFGVPHVFLGLLYHPSIWTESPKYLIDNPYFLMPCAVFITLFDVAAILEYTNRYEKIKNEYKIIK